MSHNIETADSIFGIDNLRASDYALISSLVEYLLVHKSSKKSMQLVTSHKVRTVKQPAVNSHVMQWWDSNILGTGSISNIRTTMVIRYIQVPRSCNFSKLES